MHTNTLRSFFLCILQQQYNNHWMSSSTPSTPKSNWKIVIRNRSGITEHVIKIAYESFPLCFHTCHTERSPQSVTYWRMWVPRCRSVDKIEKLVSFVDTWESDKSDFIPRTCMLSYTWSTKPCLPFTSNPFSFLVTFLRTESRLIKMTAKFSSKNQSSAVMFASIYPIIMCRGFSENRGRFLIIKPMFCGILMERQSFVWLQLRCWCSVRVRLFPVGVKTAYPETK